MKVNPPTDKQISDSDSKNATFKIVTHEGLVPLTVKMLAKCAMEKKREIDGLEFGRATIVARLEAIDPKTNKAIMTINDNTGAMKIVKISSEEDDELEPNCYYEFILTIKEDKEELMVLCDKMSRVESFDQLQYHLLNVIGACVERQNMSKDS